MKIIYNSNGTIDFLATREIMLGNPSEQDFVRTIQDILGHSSPLAAKHYIDNYTAKIKKLLQLASVNVKT